MRRKQVSSNHEHARWRILASVAAEGRKIMRSIYPQLITASRLQPIAATDSLGMPTRVLEHRGSSGVVLAFDDDGLLNLAQRHDCVIDHTLTNCLGGSGQDVQVEFHHWHFDDGDQLLLCTDGLTDMVSDQQIALVLEEPVSCQEKANALVDRALEHGGKDNVTVVLAQYALRG